MIEPLDALAFSMNSTKGVYAVLLGSGISRSASIPTGWDIILDLVRKVAKVVGAESEPNPDKWFREKFGIEPSYSELLDKLGKTGPERQGILKTYIEPTAEEREEGKKVATKAHHAIAHLAAAGHIRVILTTNFDRLMEEALGAVGVPYQSIASPDAVAGMTPLVHAPVTIVKLHGDYLDARIKNTIEELETYDPRMNGLLDQILDQFGLVICGWSGDWDTALRAAIERCPNRRYSAYWSAYNAPKGAAADLINLRVASVIQGQDADTFFDRLAEKVRALDDFQHPHPLSTATAVAALKRYLPNPLHRIKLDELVGDEVERVLEAMRDDANRSTTQAVRDVVTRYGNTAETLIALFAAGCHWGEATHDRVWTTAISRLADLGPEMMTGYVPEVLKLRRYPALQCLYAGGLVALADGNYRTLKALFTEIRVQEAYESTTNGLNALDVWRVIDYRYRQQWEGRENKYTPFNDLLFEVLRPILQAYIPNDELYIRLFDRFEYLKALVATDFGISTSPGRYYWRHRRQVSAGVIAEVDEEVTRMGIEWPLLKAGCFERSKERYVKSRDQILSEVQRTNWW